MSTYVTGEDDDVDESTEETTQLLPSNKRRKRSHHTTSPSPLPLPLPSTPFSPSQPSQSQSQPSLLHQQSVTPMAIDEEVQQVAATNRTPTRGVSVTEIGSSVTPSSQLISMESPILQPLPPPLIDEPSPIRLTQHRERIPTPPITPHGDETLTSPIPVPKPISTKPSAAALPLPSLTQTSTTEAPFEEDTPPDRFSSIPLPTGGDGEFVGFGKFSRTGQFTVKPLSDAALKKAAERMNKINGEIDQEFGITTSTNDSEKKVPHEVSSPTALSSNLDSFQSSPANSATIPEFVGFGKFSLAGSFTAKPPSAASMKAAAARMKRMELELDQELGVFPSASSTMKSTSHDEEGEKKGDQDDEQSSSFMDPSTSNEASFASTSAGASSIPEFVGFGKFSGGKFVAQTFSTEQLSKAQALLKKFEAKDDEEKYATPDETTINIESRPPSNSAPITGTISSTSTDLMEDIPSIEQATSSSLSPSSVDPSTAAASSTTPSSAQSNLRKSKFSTSLPLPVFEDDDPFPSTPLDPSQPSQPTRLTTNSNPSPSKPSSTSSHSIMPPPPPVARVTPQLSSALSKPALAPAVATTPNLNRKRPFVSPRVITKSASLLPPTPQTTNLLTVNRNNSNQGHAMNQPTHFHPQQQQQLPPQMMPLPSLGITVTLPNARSEGKKVKLREFASICRSQVAAQEALMEPLPQLNFIPHTNIPAEYITSVNASLVTFIRPDDVYQMNQPNNILPIEPSLGWLDARTSLLSLGLSSTLCSLAWVRNHYRWVVWKLASYQRRFGPALTVPCLTYERVVQQLFHRFEREMNQVKTPALKKILEGDEAPNCFLILVVAQVVGIKTPPSVALSGRPQCASWVDDTSGTIPTRPNGCEVELSDGWYSVWCKLDQQLFYQAQAGKIYPGQKLRIWGAQLTGGQLPTTPLENTETYIKLQINSVRRAYWYSTLGKQKDAAFLVNFASLRQDGGLIPAIKVAVSKQYPMIYLHPATVDPTTTTAASKDGAPSTTPDPPPKVRKAHCNERSHDFRMRLHERFCEERIEKLEAKYLDQQNQPSSSKVTKTQEQIEAENEEWMNERAALQAELQEIHKAVTPYLKLHLCELTEDEKSPSESTALESTNLTSQSKPLRWSGQCCALTVWRPAEDHRELLLPGREFIIFGATVHTRYKPPPHRSVTPTNHATSSDLPTVPHQHYIPASSNYLSLSTSRMTNIVPYGVRHAKGLGGAPATNLSTAVPVRTEFLRAPLYMRPTELLSLPRGAEFDCVCLVLWTNDDGEQNTNKLMEVGNNKSSTGASTTRWLRTRRLLCAGLSGEMMIVEVKENEELIHFSQPIQTPQLMVMDNIQYTMYDKRLRLHTAASTSVSKFTSKGGIQLPSIHAPTTTDAIPHHLFTQPSLSQTQTWFTQPMTGLLYHVLSEISRLMMDGSFNSEQVISTFNKEEFKHLPTFVVSGYLLPLDESTSFPCTKAYSLDSLLPPSSSTANSTNLDSSHPVESGSHSLLKKRTPSILGTNKPNDQQEHSQDCLESRGNGGICYQPSHTLPYLLDAIHWSTTLYLDDGCRCWPVQLDTYSFRSIIQALNKPTAASEQKSEIDSNHSSSPISDWWMRVLTTGNVPYLDFNPKLAHQSTLRTAMNQLRATTFQQITHRFQMDQEEHQKAHVADWILLVLSHSRVAPQVDYLTPSMADFLVSVHSAALVIHPEQVRADFKSTDEDVHMADAVNEEQKEPVNDESMTEKQPLTSTSSPPLTTAQLIQFHQLLTAGASSPDSHPALFYFTQLEWSAICQQLHHSLGRAAFTFQLAECERFISNTASTNGGTNNFKSVFIPKLDSIIKKGI